jgi:uncharacterized protein YjbI with pentapeptide repeats
MQNAGLRNPPVQERDETIPSHLGALTATDQNAPPQSANVTIKDAQLNRVSGNGVVLVGSQHNFPKPGTDLGRAMMLPALKLSLNGFKLRDHPLLRRNPPNDESSAAVELPTEVSETQEREGFWFSFPKIFPVSGRDASRTCGATVMWPFAKAKPTPPGVIIRNRLGEQIDFVAGVWHLENADLRHRQWPHAELSGMSLDDGKLEGAHLLGARLVRTSFSRCSLHNSELSFSDATRANFRDANMDGCLMWRSEITSACFDGSVLSASSDIPGRKTVEE